MGASHSTHSNARSKSNSIRNNVEIHLLRLLTKKQHHSFFHFFSIVLSSFMKEAMMLFLGLDLRQMYLNIITD